MVSNLYGNPHSGSPSSQLAAQQVENVRHDALRFFNADPVHFDLIFVANATAGIKLVGEALRDLGSGFEYGYHVDSHTSLVGLREWAQGGSRCFKSDEEVEEFLNGDDTSSLGCSAQAVQLFAYPAQSNMNGRRLPSGWPQRLRDMPGSDVVRRYSLLDAAAFASTAPLDLRDSTATPDFTVLSFYKIFGFPDLGALIVRKDAAHLLTSRKYFGGGTVDMVVALKEQWHAKKQDSIHAALEDGTLPTHNIVALGHAMDLHRECFVSMDRVSRYLSRLSKELYNGLDRLRHGNGRRLCEIYTSFPAHYGDSAKQGAVVTFNVRTARGAWISSTEVEKLASIHGIHLRVGGVCNPGGVAASLGLEPWEMRENLSAGFKCGSASDIVGGKPTGVVRASLGAMSTIEDVRHLVDFLSEFFVDADGEAAGNVQPQIQSVGPGDFCVESLTVYPIKSCSGWKIPASQRWQVRAEGLAWDREWCLVHQGTDTALSQKQYPRMALINPSIDLTKGLLRVRYAGVTSSPTALQEVTVPLSGDPTYFEQSARSHTSRVCGDAITAKTYSSEVIARFFTSALGVPCQLARLSSGESTRKARTRLQQHQITSHELASVKGRGGQHPLLLSNESPILTISRSSLNRLNEQIKAQGGKAAEAEVFRANIVVAQHPDSAPGTEQPYVEDYWRVLQIGEQFYEMLGSCRRCQMVCVDQETAEKDREPFATLAKTRRFDGRVWFGQHTCHLASTAPGPAGVQNPTIMVGDTVMPYLWPEAEAVFKRHAVC